MYMYIVHAHVLMKDVHLYMCMYSTCSMNLFNSSDHIQLQASLLSTGMATPDMVCD